MPRQTINEIATRLVRKGAIQSTGKGIVVDTSKLNNAESKYLKGLNSKGTIDPNIFNEEPSTTELIKKIIAQQGIKNIWEKEGGALSSLGLPADLGFNAKRKGDQYVMSFRNGEIRLVDGCEIISNTESELFVYFRGIECNVRQEKSDELYGVITVIGPANNYIRTFIFPGNGSTLSMGRSGERMVTFNEILYEKPSEDIIIIISLIESDGNADIKATANRIAEKIVEKGKEILGALTGIPAEALSKETWFQDGLGEVFGFIMDDVLGMGDDPYTPQSFAVNWSEIGEYGPRKQPTRVRPGEGVKIEKWTHKFKVTGRDDGNDLGDYEFYFDFHVIKSNNEQRTYTLC